MNIDNINNKMLFSAVKKGYYDVANFLLENGSDPNYKDIDGNNALHFNSSPITGEIDRMHKLFLKYGAIPNIPNNKGEYPYFWFQDLEHIQYYVKNGGDLNFKYKGDKPIIFNMYGGIRNIETVKYLIDNGIDVNIQSKDGETLIQYFPDMESKELILEAGFDLKLIKNRKYCSEEMKQLLDKYEKKNKQKILEQIISLLKELR